MSIMDVNKRPLPSFKQWLDEHSPGTQADGFEAFSDLAFRAQSGSLKPGLTPQQESFARMWMGACVAAVELCNMEAVGHLRPEGEIIATLPRVFAAAAMYAMASVCKESTPWRDVAKLLTEEFRAGAKASADQLDEQFPRQ